MEQQAVLPKADRMLDVCRTIAADMKLDATRFEGQPFNGRTVAEYIGSQGAAIAALADMLAEVIVAVREGR